MKTNHDYRERVHFGRRVRDLRLRLGKTQSDLARSLGFAHQSTISDIEKGRRLVYLDEVPRLARALRCDVADLLDADVPPASYPLERNPAAASCKR